MSGVISFPNGGGGTPPEGRMDLLIRALYGALPAASLEEIHAKFRAKGIQVSKGSLQQALVWLRKHPERYGWTVPHVKRGKSSDERCYFPVLREKGSVAGFSLPEEYRVYSKEGFEGTISHIANMGKNENAALRMLIQFERSRPRREEMMELLETSEYMVKKARSILRRSMNG